jgi:hypothetical protein
MKYAGFILATVALFFCESKSGPILTCPDPLGKIDERLCDTLSVKADTSLVMFQVGLPAWIDPYCVDKDPLVDTACINPKPDSNYTANMKIWSHDLFTSFELLDYQNLTHRLSAPKDSAEEIIYGWLVATKETIISIRGKSYVLKIAQDAIYAVVVAPLKKNTVRSGKERRFAPDGKMLKTRRQDPNRVEITPNSTAWDDPVE